MICKLSFLATENTIPYPNLALEEELLQVVEPGECILYLWQNRSTVVIGRNQNCRAECLVEQLAADGGHVVRRLSGGGAVFHDLGNLNFTFLVRKGDYDLDRQLGVILMAVQSLGVNAQRTGRNDIAVEGKKFSGNAFYTSGDRCYHHGTILIASDKEKMSRYLSVSAEKLHSHGVKSVQSRVVNLGELVPGLTVAQMKAALVQAFGQAYGATPQPLPPERLNPASLAKHTEKFASRQWNLGSERPFSYTTENRRFGWGGVQLQLLVQEDTIREAAFFTDALDAELVPQVTEALIGVEFSTKAVAAALAGLIAGVGDSDRETMLRDILALMEEQLDG